MVFMGACMSVVLLEMKQAAVRLRIAACSGKSTSLFQKAVHFTCHISRPIQVRAICLMCPLPRICRMHGPFISHAVLFQYAIAPTFR